MYPISFSLYFLPSISYICIYTIYACFLDPYNHYVILYEGSICSKTKATELATSMYIDDMLLSYLLEKQQQQLNG